MGPGPAPANPDPRSDPARQHALAAGLGVLTLGLVITVQTTYVFSQLPGTPVFYKQFADHLAWTTGNAGCGARGALRSLGICCR